MLKELRATFHHIKDFELSTIGENHFVTVRCLDVVQNQVKKPIEKLLNQIFSQSFRFEVLIG
jgi:hypothetical protein